MKRFLPLISAVGLLVVVAVVYAVTVRFTSHDANATTAVCSKVGQTHTVDIVNSAVTPIHTQAMLCDRLTIINKDDITRLVAFGEHDNHKAYDGVTERALQKGQAMTVTLDKAGAYEFHDHLHDEVQGTFSVVR